MGGTVDVDSKLGEGTVFTINMTAKIQIVCEKEARMDVKKEIECEN